jgi:hypothetical protein
MLALSIVSPHGKNIAEWRKTIEVRSWQPAELPLRDLVIVQNRHYLTAEHPKDEEGVAVAFVDVLEVHDWQPSEVAAARSAGWQPGYKAWALSNLRPLSPAVSAPARRKLYEISLNEPRPAAA